MSTRSRSLPLTALAAGLLVLVAVVGLNLAQRALRDRQHRALGARLRTVVTARDAWRYERPVLRGTALDGNAWTAQQDALRDLRRLPHDELSAAVDALGTATTAPTSLLTLAGQRRDALMALRASTQRAWSKAPYSLADALSQPSRSGREQLDAARLLAVQGAHESPAECLRVAADIVRLGQDLTPGGLAVSVALASMHTGVAEAMVKACVPTADADARRASAREFALLARHAPSTGRCLADDAYAITASGLRALATEPALPLSRQGFSAVAERRAFLDGAPALLDIAARLDHLDPRAYPDTLRDARAAVNLLPTHNAFVRAAMPVYDGLFSRDVHAMWRLRALAVALAAMVDEGDVAFTDPFSGAPLRADVREDRVRVAGAGVDGREGTRDDVAITLRR